MAGNDSGIPEACECGEPWVFRAPWWDSPSRNPRWGYLVHCPRRHFAWYEAEISVEEQELALRRFGVRNGGARREEDPPAAAAVAGKSSNGGSSTSAAGVP